MIFFQEHEDNCSLTPNLLFDDILVHPKVTLNQVRIISFLLRNTLSYNDRSKWTGVILSELNKKMNLSKIEIKLAIDECVSKGWVLLYEEGDRENHCIFLNDEVNQRILVGLKNGLFKPRDIMYLNLATINQILDQYNISFGVHHHQKFNINSLN